MKMDFRENMKKCEEYMEALQEERSKILVFQRELPLCLDLVTQAIEACKQQLSSTTTTTTECCNGQSECSEQTTSDGPVLEEFMPLKIRSSNSSDDDKLDSIQKPQINDANMAQNNEESCTKSDWLRSVQLWNQTPDPLTKEDNQPRKVAVAEVKNGGAFHPFQKEKSTGGNNKPASILAPSASSTATTTTDGSGGSKKEEKGGQASQRKTRRCWSPELHRRFLHALQQLGGSHVASPKQIRELMKVDGLTNDEVKSHLQKYRLHTRRPNPTIHNNGNPQAPQFVVVGSI